VFCRKCDKLVSDKKAIRGKFCPYCGRALTWFGREHVDISAPLMKAILARKNYLLKEKLEKIENFYFQENKVDVGLLELEDALKINPNNISARVHLALNYYRQMKVSRAKEEFLAILDIEPSNVESLTYLADIAVNENDYKSALKYCDIILSVEEHNIAIMYNRAVALTMLNEPERAYSQFQSILLLEPDNQVVKDAIKEIVNQA